MNILGPPSLEELGLAIAVGVDSEIPNIEIGKEQNQPQEHRKKLMGNKRIEEQRPIRLALIPYRINRKKKLLY